MRVPPREGRLTILQPDWIWISLIRVPDLPMIQPTTPGSRSMTKVASGRLICEESAAYSSSKKELGRPPSIERLAVTAARSEGGERHPGLPAVVLGRWVVSSSPRSVGRRLSATGSSGPLYTVSLLLLLLLLLLRRLERLHSSRTAKWIRSEAPASSREGARHMP